MLAASELATSAENLTRAALNELKQKVHNAFGCPPDAQRLLYNQQCLEDERAHAITGTLKIDQFEK